MKTTIDLPDHLVRRLKLRAVREGRNLKDLASEFLMQGLAHASGQRPPASPRIVKDRKTRLPVIQCPATPRTQPGPDDIAAILLDQETEWTRTR
jgi:plasmid stability protein